MTLLPSKKKNISICGASFLFFYIRQGSLCAAQILAPIHRPTCPAGDPPVRPFSLCSVVIMELDFSFLFFVRYSRHRSAGSGRPVRDIHGRRWRCRRGGRCRGAVEPPSGRRRTNPLHQERSDGSDAIGSERGTRSRPPRRWTGSGADGIDIRPARAHHLMDPLRRRKRPRPLRRRRPACRWTKVTSRSLGSRNRTEFHN